MNTLYLFEKSDQAKKVAAVLGVVKKTPHFIETPAGILTWAVGHLLTLADPEDYDSKYKTWNIADLPIFPETFKVVPNRSKKGISEKLNAIKSLIQKAELVVISTDPDREGEMIGRELLEFFKYKGSVERLWLSSLDSKSIKNALSRLRPGKDTEQLYLAALGRSRADWLTGMNLSRALTKAFPPISDTPSVYSVGRVQTPTLALVVDRDRAIDNFREQTYYTLTGTFLTSTGQQLTLDFSPDRKIFTESEIEAIGDSIFEGQFVLRSIKEEKRTLPPHLFALSDFQKEASAKLGWTADYTLAIAQALYEKHTSTTYPRTDCNYIPEEQFEDAEILVSTLTKLPDLTHMSIEQPYSRRVFNTRKITAHHAIIPTTISEYPLSNMSSDEKQGFLMIAQRYLLNLLPDYVYLSSTVTADCNGCIFSVSGQTPISLGWKRFCDNVKESVIPDIIDGESGTLIELNVNAKKTKPPARFTDGSLIDAMKSIQKYVEDKAAAAVLKETEGLGTEPTRAAIIKLLKDRNFLETKGKLIYSTLKAKTLIDTLRNLHMEISDPIETAKMETCLEEIIAGKNTLNNFLTDVKARIARQLDKVRSIVPVQPLVATPVIVVGKCPECGSDVIDKKDLFVCNKQSYSHDLKANTGCEFQIWKKNKLLKAPISLEVFQKLLAGEKVSLVTAQAQSSNFKIGKYNDKYAIIFADKE